MTTEYGYPEGEVARVESKEQIEDPSIIRIGVIGDTEVTLGFLLVGIGYHLDKFRNYLLVERDTPLTEIEAFFLKLYRRPNIGVILIDYNTSKRLVHVLEKCKKVLPVVIVVPTKSSIVPYMEEKTKLRRQQLREAYN